MRIPWRASEYERTCLDCGCSWRVPGAAGRRRLRPISGFGSAPLRSLRVDDSASELASSEAISAVVGAYGHYPDCGAAHYTQRPVKT
jgi:hypothetical protein